MKKILFIVPFCVCCFVNAQLHITSLNTDLKIDFDNTVEGINNGVFMASGFSSAPSDGQLNSNGIVVKGFTDGDVIFGEDNVLGDMTRGSSDGGVRYGGVYAFEVESGNYALGFQPGDEDFTPGEVILKLVNNAGSDINQFVVKYDMWCYNDQDRSNNFNLSYSFDNIEYILLTGSDFVSPEAKAETPEWTKESKSITISALVSNNENLYLKWTSDDVSGSGSRDELAIDNIVTNVSSAGNQTIFKGTSSEGVCVYPNPFNDNLYVKNNHTITSVKIINTGGFIMLHHTNINAQRVVLETSEFPKGIYLAEVSTERGDVFYTKIIKR